MVDDKEVTETPKETEAGNEGNGNTAPVLILLIIVPVLLVSCTLFYFFTSYRAEPDTNIIAPLESGAPTPDLTVNLKELSTHERVEISQIELQPNCTIEEYFEDLLKDVLIALYIKTLLCTPEDFHNLEKHSMPNLTSNNGKAPEPKGHFVIYIAVGLLLTSLAAALVDLYKVKGRPSKTKPQLTKRCSLADLTVLRHSRRESMRKDSIVDEQRAPIKLLGRKVSRPPLRFNN